MLIVYIQTFKVKFLKLFKKQVVRTKSMNHNQFQEPGHDAQLSWDNNLSLKRNEAKSKDVNKAKQKVGDLGTLGTLKNLSKILNF